MRPVAKKPNRDGVAMVEFAVVAPFVFLFIFGAFELMWTFQAEGYTRNAAYRAARVGARASATTDDVRTVAADFLDAMGFSDYSVAVQPSKLTPESTSVTVDITVPMTVSNLFVSNLFGFNNEIRYSIKRRR